MDMIDDGGVPDVFVSGLGRIERLSGGLVRLVFYTERVEAGATVRVIGARIIRPVANWAISMRMLSEASGNLETLVIYERDSIKPLDG